MVYSILGMYRRLFNGDWRILHVPQIFKTAAKARREIST